MPTLGNGNENDEILTRKDRPYLISLVRAKMVALTIGNNLRETYDDTRINLAFLYN
jgi:hypothetical protein